MSIFDQILRIKQAKEAIKTVVNEDAGYGILDGLLLDDYYKYIRSKPQYLTFTATHPNSTITSLVEGNPVVDGLQYSLNDREWEPYSVGTTLTLVNVGDSIKFRNLNNSLSISATDYFRFRTASSTTANYEKVIVTGNIQSLLNFSKSCPDYAFYKLFYGCWNLQSEDLVLPALVVGDYAYSNMFYSNQTLLKLHNLPAVSLGVGCYSNMYNGCTSVVGDPDYLLPAEKLEDYCYLAMLSGCKSLKYPVTLPATKLAIGCYGSLYMGCTSLEATSELPATKLFAECYARMYYNCSSLSSSPELPATELADQCYLYMYYGCSNMTSTTSAIPALSIPYRACYCMYSGCSKLNNAPTLYAESIGTSGYAYMFQNCVALTSAPALRALTLGHSCYSSMFNGCTGLTEAPELPSVDMAPSCYKKIFYGCSNLSKITVKFTEWKEFIEDGEPYLISEDWVSGVSSTGTFTCPAELVEVRGTSGIPEGWTIQIVGEDPDVPGDVTDFEAYVQVAESAQTDAEASQETAAANATEVSDTLNEIRNYSNALGEIIG